MKVYCCQLDIAWEEKAENFARVRNLLAAARPEEGSLVLLPEMFATGFTMNVDAAADEGEAGVFLGELARRMGIYLLAGRVTRAEDGRGRNEAVLLTPEGQEAACYRKLHPFTFGGESAHYAPGNDLVVAECGDFRVCPFICYDLRFPEVFRAGAARGATLFAVIANWPASRESHWRALLRARAIENQAYVAGVNRCGRDPKNAYSGVSMIVDPRGEVAAEADDTEMAISAALDREALETYRKEFPALADMRADFVNRP